MIKYWAVQISVIAVVLVVLGLVSLSILWAFPGRPEEQKVGFGIYAEEK